MNGTTEPDEPADQQRRTEEDPRMSPLAPPAPSAGRTSRVAVTVRLLPDWEERLRAYTKAVGSNRQTVFDHMLTEYLTARGYTPGGRS